MKLTAEDIEDFKNLNEEDFDSFVKSLEEHPFEKNHKIQEFLRQKPIWEIEGEGESSFTDSLKSDPIWKEVVSD